MANLSLALDRQLWGPRIVGYKLSSLFLHIVCALLVAAWVREVLLDFGISRVPIFATTFAGLTFLLHPVQAEGAIWVENRAIQLCALFSLVAYGLIVRHWRATHATRIDGRYVSAVVAYLCALFSHEAATAVALGLVLHALARGRRERWARLREIVPFVLLAIVFALLRFFVVRAGTVLRPQGPSLALSWRVLTVVLTLGTYARSLLWPVGLCVDRFFVVPRGVWYPGVRFALLLVILWGISAVWLSRKRLALSFGLGLLFVLLLPASNLVFIAGRPIADQRLYLPMVSFALICAGFGHAFERRHGALLLALLVVWAAGLTRRAFDFSDDVRFWRRAIVQAPRKSRVLFNLAVEYEHRGLFTRAELLYRRLVELYPTHAGGCNGLGKMLLLRDDVKSALPWLQKACELKPNVASFRIDLAVALVRSGRSRDALATLESVLSLPTAPSTAWFVAGKAYEKLGRTSEATAAYAEARRRAARQGGVP